MGAKEVRDQNLPGLQKSLLGPEEKDSVNHFYVYILRRPDKVDPFDETKSQPFYVGKGCNGRLQDHRREAKRLQHKPGGKIVKILLIHKLWKQKLDFEEEIYKDNLTENKAHEIECLLIRRYGRINNNTGVLSNMTDGGDGVVGLIMPESAKELLRQHANKRTPEQRKKCGKPGKIISPEQRLKISKATKGKVGHWKGKHLSLEHKRKLSEAFKGRYVSPETRQRMSEAQKGEKNAMYGRKISEETRRKMSEANKNISIETRKKMSESQKGKKHKPESIEKIRKFLMGKLRSEETKKKVSEGLKRYFANKKGGDVKDVG